MSSLRDFAHSFVAKKSSRMRGPRDSERAPLARTSPPNTTANHGNATRATQRGEGRGSFETAMLPRRG